ncbi:hypothetical protein GCM10009715_25540 [Paeniglutamicibacter psychrophenolicus]|uniref:DUF4386 family protein n=1 Tax=Paeniglutamicibacter psychrophenolicus TaxID=257454 RepID=A0ABS4WE83_9MICC|nr:hypothetical protein [Paeniglutamicibacter psychrophenolicus]MBP2374507.1 hypothetical protein [Paeniglutamicibacter psychrophenolicus]
MEATTDSIRARPGVRFGAASPTLLLAAAVLFLVSALIQQQASRQGWDLFSSQMAEEAPGADPLEQFAAINRLIGAATGLKVLGILAMAAGVPALPRAAGRRKAAVAGSVAAFLAAGAFAAWAIRALVTGTSGTQTIMAESPFPERMLLLLSLAGLVAAAISWRGSSLPATFACVFLLGSTVLGDFTAAILLAPLLAMFAGDGFFPWNEMVVIASTAAAGLSMLFAVGSLVRRARVAR